jgi:adenosylcobinamide-phosphate synthase
MNLLAIVLALALEQWRSLRWRGAFRQLFRRYARALERRFNAGTAQQGAVAGALALLPPVALAAATYWGLDQIGALLGVVWNVAILYLLVGFRFFSHAFTAIADALKAGDAIAARKRLIAWRGSEVGGANAEEIPKLAIEQGLLDAYTHVFGTLFWFLVLPGPTGAVLYTLTTWLSLQWRGDALTPMGSQLALFGNPIQRLRFWLDWLPVRLTAMTFAVVGDFEDAVYCWRTQAEHWPVLHDGILLASAGGALGCALGGALTTSAGELEFRPELGMGDAPDVDVMPSATGLVWRALLVWLALLLLLTLAYWAP